ncbi:MAG: Bug family tripartite tricarboxylate transporter substrate binding protein [Burkholderiaceae bacterium]
MSKRHLLKTLMLSALVAAAPISALAQTAAQFPSKPIRIIAPYPPGGATDLLARALADGLQATWNSPVVVENKPGASGMIGAELASQAPGDGYTLVIGAVSLHAILPALNPKMGEVQKLLTPISMLGVNPSYVVVPATLPINNVRELISYLKTSPGKHGYGAAGIGTSQHIFVELFKQHAGVDIFPVQYKGSGPMITDLIGGQTTLVIEQGPAVMGHIRNGKLRALAVTTPKRSIAMPDVPTLAEAALPGFDASTWFAVYGSPGIPADIQRKLSDGVNRALAIPEIRERLTSAGVEPGGSTPEQLHSREKKDAEMWAEVIRRNNIKLN